MPTSTATKQIKVERSYMHHIPAFIFWGLGLLSGGALIYLSVTTSQAGGIDIGHHLAGVAVRHTRAFQNTLQAATWLFTGFCLFIEVWMIFRSDTFHYVRRQIMMQDPKLGMHAEKDLSDYEEARNAVGDIFKIMTHGLPLITGIYDCATTAWKIVFFFGPDTPGTIVVVTIFAAFTAIVVYFGGPACFIFCWHFWAEGTESFNNAAAHRNKLRYHASEAADAEHEVKMEGYFLERDKILQERAKLTGKKGP